jgi:hypothetical protein
MIVAVLLITRLRNGHTLEELRQAMDLNAPRSVTLVAPGGGRVHVCVVDIHRPYERACASMGFVCRLAVYQEMIELHYSPTRMLDLGAYKWLHVFGHIWMRDPY